MCIPAALYFCMKWSRITCWKVWRLKTSPRFLRWAKVRLWIKSTSRSPHIASAHSLWYQSWVESQRERGRLSGNSWEWQRTDARMSSAGSIGGGSNYDREAVRSIMQSWVEAQMRTREAEFLRSAQCRLFCGTFNVNAAQPEGGLHAWLLPKGTPVADIYAIGYQDIVDPHVLVAPMGSSIAQQRAIFWREKTAECLVSTQGRFSLIAQRSHAGLLLLVFVREALLPHLGDVRRTAVKGAVGKGAVAVRLALFDNTLCFVCAHLASHRDNVAGRNADHKSIFERLIFPAENGTKKLGKLSGDDRIEQLTLPRTAATRDLGSDLAPSAHDLIFWLGDLNYRLDESLSISEAFDMIEKQVWQKLREKDQLLLERARGTVFQGFEEGPLSFPPTYKFRPGSNSYDMRTDKKARAPAWCDRVLWRAKKDAVQLLSYRSAELSYSDHRPVSALLHLELRSIEESSRQISFNKLLTLLRKNSSTNPPRVVLEGLSVVLERALYEQPQLAVVKVRNTGDSIAHWHFAPKQGEESPFKRWVSVNIKQGLLLPGETFNIMLTVLVDRKAAQSLNSGLDTLNDQLLLRVERDSDYYVSVSATFRRSCYGMSLTELVRTLDPVATTELPTRKEKNRMSIGSGTEDRGFSDEWSVPSFEVRDADIGSPDLDLLEYEMNNRITGTEGKLSVPKELWRLVDALWAGNTPKTRDLFERKADAAEVGAIRSSLDCGMELPVDCSVHALCEALVSFLGALPQPLLPSDLYPSGEVDPTSMRPFCRNFLECLPPLHYNCLVYVLSFMRELLSQANYNGCSPLQLAHVCTGCMMLSGEDLTRLSRDERQQSVAKQAHMQPVLIHLLTTSAL